MKLQAIIFVYVCYVQAHFQALSLCPSNNTRIIDIDGLVEYIKTLKTDPKYYPGIVDDLLKMLDLNPHEPNPLREKTLTIALVQFALNFNVNSKDDCEEVLIADSFDMNKKSEFINLDELTQVENVMIDAEMTDDLKLQLLRILFSFHSGANELNRATALLAAMDLVLFTCEQPCGYKDWSNRLKSNTLKTKS